MRIFIPTLARAKAPKKTVAHIPSNWRSLTSLVCHVDEEEDYAPVAVKHGVNLLALDVKGIAKTRQEIGLYCAQQGVSSFMMLDDDLEFYIRRLQHEETDDWWKLSAPTDQEIDRLFCLIEEDLLEHAHVGVSGREGNNRVRDSWVLDTRYIRLLAFQTEAFNACEHGRVKVMEDFDVALQLLRKGLSCKVWYEFAQGQAKTQAAGGCSTYRDHAMQTEAANRLAELHPDFVRTRLKENKTDRDGFGPRTEVTIQWKKARRSADMGDDT